MSWKSVLNYRALNIWLSIFSFIGTNLIFLFIFIFALILAGIFIKRFTEELKLQAIILLISVGRYRNHSKWFPSSENVNVCNPNASIPCYDVALQSRYLSQKTKLSNHHTIWIFLLKMHRRLIVSRVTQKDVSIRHVWVCQIRKSKNCKGTGGWKRDRDGAIAL